MVWCYIYIYIYKRQYTDKTLTLRKCMCMRASEASELRKFWYFYILKLLFLSIFCRYTSDTLSVQMTCLSAYMYRQIPNVPTNFQMYRQKSEKALLGGGGGGNCPLCPPSGYANAGGGVPSLWFGKKRRRSHEPTNQSKWSLDIMRAGGTDSSVRVTVPPPPLFLYFFFCLSAQRSVMYDGIVSWEPEGRYTLFNDVPLDNQKGVSAI